LQKNWVYKSHLTYLHAVSVKIMQKRRFYLIFSYLYKLNSFFGEDYTLQSRAARAYQGFKALIYKKKEK